MLTFIHGYEPRYMQGLLQHGMFQKKDGLKVTQHYLTPEHMRFNVLAAKGGDLYHYVKEMAGAFYIDRLQGGTFISKYPFDMALVEEYDRITNGNFLGFQIHETGGTRAYDWGRIKKQMKETNLPWTLENIIYAVTLVSHDKQYPHFSNGHPEEYAALTPPEDLFEYMEDVKNMWASRQEMLRGRSLNCDCVQMLCGIEYETDMEISFIEVGAQGGFIRNQFAFRRGISRARGKKWGVYTEPWSRNPCNAYIFMRDNSNEWNIDVSNFLYKATGENGGSSMSMARRLLYYSLFAGADYLSEEWGRTNTFYEWDTFELSPYGKIKKEFLALARKLQDVKPYVPFAFVLPKKFKYFAVDGWTPFKGSDEDVELKKLAATIQSYFSDDQMIGMEDYIMTCGGWGSLFDIIYEDSYDSPQQEYELLIDLSGSLHGKNVVNGFDKEASDRAIARFVDNLPFTLSDDGKLDYQIFSNEGDTYLVLYNHKGVSKSQEEGERVHQEATVSYTLTLPKGRIPEVIELDDSSYKMEEGCVTGTLRGGSLILFRI